MSTKITSRAVLNAGSLGRLPLKEGAEIGFGNLKRETVMGDDGPLGFTEEFSEAPLSRQPSFTPKIPMRKQSPNSSVRMSP